MAKDEIGHVELRQCGFVMRQGRFKVVCTNRMGHADDHHAGFVSWERLFGDPQPPALPSTGWGCRVKQDCGRPDMTLQERDEHERTEHPGQHLRRDLGDIPYSARRHRHA